MDRPTDMSDEQPMHVPRSAPTYPHASARDLYGEDCPPTRYAGRFAKGGALAKRLDQLHAREVAALRAYELAHRRLRDAVSREQLRRFIGDRHLHLRQLEFALRPMGVRPSRKLPAWGAWTRVKVGVGGWLSDRTVMRALRSQAEHLTDAYQALLCNESLPDETRAVLARGVEDQHRHREWIVDRAGHP